MVIKLSYAQNNIVLESTTPYATLWSDTDWKKTYKYVNKQRFRIFRAESEGDSRKVRDLQRMLVRSPAALKVAIKRVTQTNKGKRTPGVDRYLALSDAERGKLFIKIINRNINKHNPKPVYRTQIPKSNGKTRSLGIPTIIDRVYQELLRLVLEPQWEARFEPISYGFRPARRVHDAMERIFHDIHYRRFNYVFEGDFKACFDTLSHEFIMEQLKGFPYVGLVEKFLKAGYVKNGEFFSTNQGTPQGGLLSPLLANIALHGLENCLNISYYEYHSSKGYMTFITRGKYRVVRYADDFLIFARNKEDIEAIPNILKEYLDRRGLILSEDKTCFTTIFKGFDFLGFNVKIERDNKCIIKPSKDSVKKAKAKIKDIFEYAKGQNVEYLIDKLNPVLDGIAEFWKPMASSKAFSNLDNYIWKKNWKFLNHLHPNKSSGWIVNKYFPRPEKDDEHQDKWILTDSNTGKQLNKMSWTNIERHTMIKHNYSPLDKSKSDYFYKRRLSTANIFR